MRSRVVALSVLTLAIGWAGTACAQAQGDREQRADSAAAATAARPTLVVLVTIDQFRADYLTRFGGQLTGGLARLVKGGAVFTDAHQDHAITETAPGHASLLSGRFPRSTGIMMNSIGVSDTESPLIAGGNGPGASPRRFTGTTLVDWLRAEEPRSRALSVSVKDRGAILPVGRSKSDVYWYSLDGRFVTSSYYRETLPSWVNDFNARRLPQGYAGRSWTLLLPDSAYAERDSVPAESGGRNFTFPHELPPGGDDVANIIRGTPFIDEVTVAFALEGVRQLKLGTGPQTDLLAVSLSSTDYVGHRFGPDSREIHDQVLRDDRTIGVLIDSLYRLRDSARVLIVLSSDHGVGSIPEVAAANGTPGATRVELYDALPAVHARLRASGLDTLALQVDPPLVFLDRKAFAGRDALADSVLAVFAKAATQVNGVRRVDRFPTLLADSLRDPIARRWAHQLPANANVAAIVTLDSLSTWGGTVASHGSAYDYDSHVPLIFYGAGVKPGRNGEFVRTVDIAPTLGAVLGVRPSERVDGVVIGGVRK